MKIQMINGGLANQIQQFVFARYIERHFPEEKVIFDDSMIYAHPIHNGFELESVFGLKLNLLSYLVNDEAYQKVIQWGVKGIWLPEILLTIGIPIVLINDYFSHKPHFSGESIIIRGFEEEVIKLPYTNLYYLGVWSDRRWFSAYEKENLAELEFPELTDKKNLEYAENICKGMSVGIHIRRGDFLSLGWSVPKDIYKKTCMFVLERYSDVRFFIFSDDLEWCRGHAEELGFELTDRVKYVSGNTNGKNYVDMQLLSMCKGIIRPAQSTFSQVAGWLDKNLEFEIPLGKRYIP